MCGFVGIIGLNKQQVIAPMLESIRSRGPDDTGFVQGQWFDLGFCRLSIVALSEGRQPVSNISGDVHLVFNGEIYNFRSIRNKLLESYSPRDDSEAKVLLSCYEKYGPSFVSHLDGVFAIAVVDCRSRVCYLFRDPFGVKPLYYSSIDGGNTWVFTSDLRAFFNYPGFSTDLNWVALAERRILNFWAADRTCFEKIRQLPPGHFLKLQLVTEPEDTSIQAESVAYFSLNHACRHEGEGASAQDVVEKCSELLRVAVAKRVQHTEVYPVVLALSGGIDSSLIAALLSKVCGKDAVAVTICDNPHYGDPRYAAQVAYELRLSHHTYRIALTDFLNEFPRMVLTSGGIGPSYFPYLLGRAVRELEPTAKVILCGEGADEFSLGYQLYIYPDIYVSKVLDGLQSIPPKTIEMSPLLQRTSKWILMNHENMWLDFVSLFQHDQLVNAHLLPFDHGPMAFGLECRVPFLDRELVEHIQTVPAHLRILGETPKIFLRLVLADLFSDKPALVQSLSKRCPCPAFFATNRSRGWLEEFLEEKIQGSELRHSRLAALTKDSVDLFWFASVIIVFLVHRGNISGMTFEDLTDQVFNLAIE